MKLEECYEQFGGSYEKVKGHLQKDTLIQRFVIKFLSDGSYEALKEAMEKKDYEAAFRAVHTLKGVSENLCFQRLSNSASLLTEALRNRNSAPVDKERCEELWQAISENYMEVVEAIHSLQQSLEQ